MRYWYVKGVPFEFIIVLTLKNNENSNRQMRQLYAYVASESTLRHDFLEISMLHAN